MRKFFLCSFSCFLLVSFTKANSSYLSDTSFITGRWDITINISGKTYPSWLEIERSGNNSIVGQFVGIVGSARPISQISFSNGKISFSIPPQWERGANNLSFEATIQADSLTGSITFPDGKNYTCSAVHAPSLLRKSLPAWDKPIHLITTILNGWHISGQNNQWIIENGVLKSPKPGSNLITDALFTDFKLHIEFRYSKNGNSGVYLRGRYEVQIADTYEAAQKDQFGAVYGFLPPSEMAAKKPGEWQSYDITLIGRMITIVANGKTIICNREIPGITGGALNSKEAEPGPLMLQGDHGPIEYRNIVITPSK
jgi:hypothetical protein